MGIKNIMTEQNDTPEIEEQTGMVRITLEGREIPHTQEQLGVTMDSTEDEILAAVRNIVAENIVDDSGEFSYTVRKAFNTKTIFVYPKPVAG